MAASHVWLDGRLAAAGEALLPLDDSAFLQGLGCYTTARFVGGRVRLASRAAARLARDARALGLGDVDPDACREAMLALGTACFGRGEGIVRLQASRDAAGRLRLSGTAREVGPEPATWSAVVADFAHPGPGPAPGAKVTSHLAFALAREAARRRGADEALLADASGRLVEGARTNVLVADASGGLRTPPLSRGAVRGVARGLLCEACPELREEDVSVAELASAREILVANSVRGVVPVVRLDRGRGSEPVGVGGPGPWARRLAALLAEDPDW